MMNRHQGPGPVAMITAASMFAAMELSPKTLGCHPVYLAMAIEPQSDH